MTTETEAFRKRFAIIVGIVLTLLIIMVLGLTLGSHPDERKALEFHKRLSEDVQVIKENTANARWLYITNMTDDNFAKYMDASYLEQQYLRTAKNDAIKIDWTHLEDEELKDEIGSILSLGKNILPDEKFEKLEHVKRMMETIHKDAKICDYYSPDDCNLSFGTGLARKLAKSTDVKEMENIWLSFRDVTGKKIRPYYPEYVELINEVAKLDELPDAAALWLSQYGHKTIEDQIEKLWSALKPHYLQLHAFVRRLLREKYGPEVISRDGPIPAHLFGSMWAQNWATVAHMAVPYPKKIKIDVTNELLKQNYTVLKLFKTAEDFYVSMGFPKLPASFWKNSIFERPKDNRTMDCHPTAIDFFNGRDFRVLMCESVTQSAIATIHHLLGHIVYFMEYKDLPIAFRHGANSGFHEAIGDTIALSAMTPKHLKRLKLIKKEENDYQADVNEIFQQALEKIAFLPYAYLLDFYRWSIFRGKIKKEVYNCEYWRLREEFQGLKPPTERTEEDFDAGSKHHVASDTPYIRYFLGTIIQFQFHQALCTEAGEFDPANPNAKPLHECDIYGSVAAGTWLKNVLRMGSKEVWRRAMEEITGQRSLDATPLITYFKPFLKWVQKENKRTGEYIGWISEARDCKVGS